MYHVKQELNQQGHDMVKKLMCADGHLVSEGQHYIRDRKGRYAVYDDQYAIRLAYKDYNAYHPVILQIQRSE